MNDKLIIINYKLTKFARNLTTTTNCNDRTQLQDYRRRFNV